MAGELQHLDMKLLQVRGDGAPGVFVSQQLKPGPLLMGRQADRLQTTRAGLARALVGQGLERLMGA